MMIVFTPGEIANLAVGVLILAAVVAILFRR